MAVCSRILAVVVTAFVAALPFGRDVIVGASQPSAARPNVVLAHGARAGATAYRSALLRQRTTRPPVLVTGSNGPVTTTPVIPDPEVRTLVCVTRQPTSARQAAPGTFMVQGGHLSMLSSPGTLADLIIAAVRKTH
jgi:hypothetical protein